MEQKSNWRLLSKRNILGAVLVAGIAVGLYFGDLWKGFGGGNSLGVGTTDHSSTSVKDPDAEKRDANAKTGETAKTVAPSNTDIDVEKSIASIPGTHRVVKVVIADRSYFVRSTIGDVPTDLNQLVKLVKAATGDEDGIRIRIYRRPTSRTTTELALRDALLDAGIAEEHVVWNVNPQND